MDGPSRWDRAAAATLTFVGILLVGAAIVLLVMYLPDVLGARGEHLAGDTTLFLVFVLVPIAVGGSIALLSARLLWRGSPGGVAGDATSIRRRPGPA